MYKDITPTSSLIFLNYNFYKIDQCTIYVIKSTESSNIFELDIWRLGEVVIRLTSNLTQ